MNKLSHKVLYEAFKAKDFRFDGLFFAGITSTGIYCRPVCKARIPKEENCLFFETAAAAEQNGFRPCLLCRPELAPALNRGSGETSLFDTAIRMLEEFCSNNLRLEYVAKKLGCSSRHLRRVFHNQMQVTPVQYMQTCKLLLAKNLLTESQISITDIAMATGFGSIRRFNDLFKKQYRLSPRDLRKEGAIQHDQQALTTATIGYRPPYQWQQMLNFLQQRAIPGVEIVKEARYARAFSYTSATNKKALGWVCVQHKPEKNALTLSLSNDLLPFLTQIIARVRHLFDMRCNPQSVYAALSSMNDIRAGIAVEGTRVPGCFDPFEMAIRAVLGQQITVKAASTLAGRLAQNYGDPLAHPTYGLTHCFPTAQTILSLPGDIADHLGPLGIIRSRAKTIYALAEHIEDGTLDLTEYASPKEELTKLLRIPGIGVWTANYIIMRTIGWTDVFLHTDLAIKKALAPRTEKQILDLAETWRPWGSYATIALWNSL